MEDQRFEFEHFVVDVVRESKGREPLAKDGDFGIVWMKPDEGSDHEVLSFEKFNNMEDLELAEMGFKLLLQASARNSA